MNRILERAKYSFRDLAERNRCAAAVWVFVLAAILYSAPLGRSALYTRGEAREALVVRAMIDQHNFVLPLRNGTIIPSKPPFYHWCAALPFYFFDSRSEFWLRLPSAFAAALTLGAFFYFAATRLGGANALLGTLILATAFDFTRAAAAARVDMMFTVWVTLGSLCLFTLCEDFIARRMNYGFFLLTAAVIGFAALSKGPAGIVLPWMVAGIFLLCSMPVKQLPWAKLILCGVISLLIASLWYLNAYAQGGAQFLDVQLVRENLARVTGNEDYQIGHRASPLAIVPMLVSGLLPWSLFLPPLAVALYRGRKQMFAADPAVKFCVIWSLSYLVLFSLLSSKRNVYLLPSYPAYAYLFAACVKRLDDSRRAKNFSAIVFGACAAIMISAAVFVALSFVLDFSALYGKLASKNAKLEVFPVVSAGLRHLLPLLLLSLALLWQAFRNYLRRGFAASAFQLASFVALLIVGAQILVVPSLAEFSSPRNFLAEVTRSLPAGAPLYQYREEYYAADFYAGRDVEVVTEKPPLTGSQEGYIVLAEDDLAAALKGFPGLAVVKTSDSLNVYGTDRFLLARFTAAS